MCLSISIKNDEETGNISPGLSSGVESIAASGGRIGGRHIAESPMQTVILTAFNQARRPITTVVTDGSNTHIYDLYKPNTGRKIHDIKTDMQAVKDLFGGGGKIVVNDFLHHVQAYGLNAGDLGDQIHDVQIGEVEPDRLSKLASRLMLYKPRLYDKLLADVSIVYADLSERGLFYNYGKVKVDWSVDTFTKRSKSLNFNLQGFTDEAHIRTPYASEQDILICFDWMAADIRAAAAMSGDQALSQSFLESDPYSFLQKTIGGDITRDECKLLLLKTINSLDYKDGVVRDVYPALCEWLRAQDDLLAQDGGISSLLGRKFNMSKTRSKLSALNGVIQGTVAHAMHVSLRKIWDQYPHRLVGEIHDSVILNCPPVKSEMLKMIKDVTAIMVRPFEGLLQEELIFPVRISIGNKWKNWKHIYSCRGGKIVSET